MGHAPPVAWSPWTSTPGRATGPAPASTPRRATTHSWPVPPRTRAVQVEEPWARGAPREASCDPRDPLDRFHGDDWDHAAVAPERRLLWARGPGQRADAARARWIRPVHDRTGGRTDLPIPSAEHAPCETAIHAVDGVEPPRPKRPGPGRPPPPVTVAPPEPCHAPARQRREQRRVLEVARTVVFGTLCPWDAHRKRSTARPTIHASFGERHHGTDRQQNSRKWRQTRACAKDLARRRAASNFVGYGSHFCWAARTPRTREPQGPWQARTPAMIAGLSNHVWSIDEGITYPATPR
jgi:hypothetical protein